MMARAKKLGEDVSAAVSKVNKIDEEFTRQSKTMTYEMGRCQSELNNMHQFMQGKINVMIEADGELRRDQALLHERMSMGQDDMRLTQEELQHLKHQCTGALEESEQLRTTLGIV